MAELGRLGKTGEGLCTIFFGRFVLAEKQQTSS
jgi:hypothetical protein